MFRRTAPTDCTLTWNGDEIPARSGESLAASLLAAGVTHFRDTALSGVPRGPLCLMGACFDCLVEVDGVANRQACLRPKLDQWGNTSLPGVMVAGDGGGIGGARASALAGRIAAMEVARWLGRITAVHALMAGSRGVLPGSLEPLRTRFPTKPVTVGELAGLA